MVICDGSAMFYMVAAYTGYSTVVACPFLAYHPLTSALMRQK